MKIQLLVKSLKSTTLCKMVFDTEFIDCLNTSFESIFLIMWIEVGLYSEDCVTFIEYPDSFNSIFQVFSLIKVITVQLEFLISIHFESDHVKVNFQDSSVNDPLQILILSRIQFLNLKISIGSFFIWSLIFHFITDQVLELICGKGA